MKIIMWILLKADDHPYVSDVNPDYTGQKATVDQFDIIGGMISIEFDDKNIVWCFPDEIQVNMPEDLMINQRVEVK